MYKPQQFNVPMKIMKPTSKKQLGVNNPTYQNINELGKDTLFFGSFKTYGGTEKVINGVVTIEDTANIETWYNPLIQNDCRIYVPQQNKVYEIISEPENIEMRNQYMKFKVRLCYG